MQPRDAGTGDGYGISRDEQVSFHRTNSAVQSKQVSK